MEIFHDKGIAKAAGSIAIYALLVSNVFATETTDGYVSMRSAAQIKKLVAGKTFYFVDNYGHIESHGIWEKSVDWGVVRFDANASHLTYREFGRGGEHGTLSVQALPNVLKMVDEEGAEYSYLGAVNRKFLAFEDEGYTRLYKKKSDARKYISKLRKEQRGFTPSMLVGKSYTVVFMDTYAHPNVSFDQDTVTISEGGTEMSFPYRLEKGFLVIDGAKGTFGVALSKKMPGYFEAKLYAGEGNYQDYTDRFKTQYHRGVAAFGDDAHKLAKYFIRKGLMGHKVTRDGRILGEVTGYWEADGNEFKFSLPKGETLEFMSFRLEGGKIFLKEHDRKSSSIRLYTDANQAEAFLSHLKEGDKNVNPLRRIRGKKLYMNQAVSEEEKAIDEFTFLKNGKAFVKIFNPHTGKMRVEDRFRYRVKAGSPLIVTVDKDGEREYHRIVDHGKNWIAVRETSGDMSYFYTNRLAASEGILTLDVDGEPDSHEVPYRLDEGEVDFYDSQGVPIAAPSDAWVRLTARDDDGEYKWDTRMSCKVQPDGRFKDYCFIHAEDRAFWDRVLSDPDRLYQIVVFRNHIEPQKDNWDCGEDVYRYVGQDLTQDNWSQIVVTPDDYQDRSSEQCR
ncbi:hypothetical protein [Nitratifractor sp.]